MSLKNSDFSILNYDVKEKVEEYAKKHKIYESFRVVLERYIKELINDAVKKGKIDENSVEIKSRTKTIDSFKGKISRDDKNYKDPLEDVTDLVGIKIMLTSLKEESEIYELLKLELKDIIDEKNSIDKTSSMFKERKFGYLGRHLVIKFDDNFIKIKHLDKKHKNINIKDLCGLKAEIQIKTLLQHVWAEVEHKSRYKAGEELDIDKKRYFDRLAALIEVADDLFKDLIDETERINQKSIQHIEEKLEKNQKNDTDKNQDKKHSNKLLISSESIALYLANKAVKQKFKELTKEGLLDVLYDEEPSLISANFVKLLKLIKIEYIEDLDLLFEEKNKDILYRYAQEAKLVNKHISKLPKLSVLQILAYAMANSEQRSKIKENRLIFERICRVIDNFYKEKKENE